MSEHLEVKIMNITIGPGRRPGPIRRASTRPRRDTTRTRSASTVDMRLIK